MASTTNKPQDAHDDAPKATEKPNRADAADRDILPGADDETQVIDTGYVSNTEEDAPAAEGDPDSIEAYKKVQDEEKAAAEAAREAE